ncbi:MAG: aminoacetone oxidase family FAD-binding enzyme [Clostridium sp.]|nr:aminoacetone oxidase family FAD-binding enzyme [Clostridium sp.]
MMEIRKDGIKIAVIGAGASGMTAAITAAGYGAEVTLFEKNDRVGKKILSTGNGKCNLGNLEFSMEQYYCEDKEKLRGMFRAFTVWDTISFFESLGLMIRNKDGYLYPYSEQASAVLDVLRMGLREKKINVVSGTEITDISFQEKKKIFELKNSKGEKYLFQKVIIACGSPASLKNGEGTMGYRLARQLGHRIRDVQPGLVQLRSGDSFMKALSGIRCRAGLALLVNGKEAAREEGELQFTGYGLSGIPVFQVSRIAAYALKEGKAVEAAVDFFPDQEEKAFVYINRLRFGAHKEEALEDYFTGTLNKKLNMVMIKQAGLKPQMKAAEAGWDRIWAMEQKCRAFPIHIEAVNSMENAQVCAGGVDFEQVDVTLESKLAAGIYFSGEVLDVDGKCGGYNLQWAWTSGYIAGRNAAGSSTREISEAGWEDIRAEEDIKAE